MFRGLEFLELHRSFDVFSVPLLTNFLIAAAAASQLVAERLVLIETSVRVSQHLQYQDIHAVEIKNIGTVSVPPRATLPPYGCY